MIGEFLVAGVLLCHKWQFHQTSVQKGNGCIDIIEIKNTSIIKLKLQPAIFPLSKHIISFHKLPADQTMQLILQNSKLS